VIGAGAGAAYVVGAIVITGAGAAIDVAGNAVEYAAGTEVDPPVAGTAETLPPAGIAMAGAGAGEVTYCAGATVILGAGAAIGALYVGTGCAVCGAVYVAVAGAAIGAPIVGMYAANSCGLRKPLLSVSIWLNKLIGAAADAATGAVYVGIGCAVCGAAYVIEAGAAICIGACEGAA